MLKIVISPAKKMNITDEFPCNATVPVFSDRADVLHGILKNKNIQELKTLWKCSDKLADENFERIKSMNLKDNLTPAILTYEGIVFQHIVPALSYDKNIKYLQENLRILSGLYGVLKALDGITLYRLEMQSKLKVNEFKNLYDFWGIKLYKEISDESKTIINLASKEYSKCIEKFLSKDDKFITCSFVEMSGEKLVVKGTYSKMARGEMVRFMAENNIENPVEIQKFDRLGYSFRSDLSSDSEYVFERKIK